jgi:uncharacterized protein
VIQKTFSTHYRSAIAFGKARVFTEDGERRMALECLMKKYSPDFIAEGQAELERSWDRVYVVEVQIEHMTGKAAIALIN